MSVHRCPDCVGHDYTNCPTCEGSAYVHRNGNGRITRPATPREYFDSIQVGKRPGSRPSPQGFRTNYGRMIHQREEKDD